MGKEKDWEKISFGYNTSLQNKINFYAKKFNTPGFYNKFKNGYRENIYNDNHPEVYMIALLIDKRPRRSPTCSEASRQR